VRRSSGGDGERSKGPEPSAKTFRRVLGAIGALRKASGTGFWPIRRAVDGLRRGPERRIRPKFTDWPGAERSQSAPEGPRSAPEAARSTAMGLCGDREALAAAAIALLRRRTRGPRCPACRGRARRRAPLRDRDRVQRRSSLTARSASAASPATCSPRRLRPRTSATAEANARERAQRRLRHWQVLSASFDANHAGFLLKLLAYNSFDAASKTTSRS